MSEDQTSAPKPFSMPDPATLRAEADRLDHLALAEDVAAAQAEPDSPDALDAARWAAWERDVAAEFRREAAGEGNDG